SPSMSRIDHNPPNREPEKRGSDPMGRGEEHRSLALGSSFAFFLHCKAPLDARAAIPSLRGGRVPGGKKKNRQNRSPGVWPPKTQARPARRTARNRVQILSQELGKHPALHATRREAHQGMPFSQSGLPRTADTTQQKRPRMSKRPGDQHDPKRRQTQADCPP